MAFIDSVRGAIADAESQLCIGLDPQRDLIQEVSEMSFIRRVVGETADLVCAYKLNLAFYTDSPSVTHIINHIRRVAPRVLIIGDCKYGDVGDTAKIQAKQMFEEYGFDAITVNPLVGYQNGLEHYIDYKDKGIFVWVMSSNPGAQDVFKKVYPRIMSQARQWNMYHNNLGLISGIPYSGILNRIRNTRREKPILVPGIGVQGGDMKEALSEGRDRTIISVSRSILYGTKSIRDNALEFLAQMQEVK